jgi:PAS domain-containing protein
MGKKEHAITLKVGSKNESCSVMTRIRDSYKLWILPLLLLLGTLFYYFGELVDWAAWDALRWNFFYSVHDIHRLVFLAPIIYAGYVGRVKGAVIITLVTFTIFLPRAFLISPYPDPLLRMALFTISAGVIGILTGMVRNEIERTKQLRTTIRNERDSFLNVINNMADGVLIIGPDYKIRFMNSIMAKDFGEGVGSFCYRQLYNKEKPCEHSCFIRNVVEKRQVKKLDYSIKNKTYEVFSTPYTDIDGVVCQLSIFREVTSP